VKIDQFIKNSLDGGSSPLNYNDRFEYLLKHKDSLMDDIEKKRFTRHKHKSKDFEFIKIADELCQP
jgi:hypothetical protein